MFIANLQTGAIISPLFTMGGPGEKAAEFTAGAQSCSCVAVVLVVGLAAGEAASE